MNDLINLLNALKSDLSSEDRVTFEKWCKSDERVISYDETPFLLEECQIIYNAISELKWRKKECDKLGAIEQTIKFLRDNWEG